MFLLSQVKMNFKLSEFHLLQSPFLLLVLVHPGHLAHPWIGMKTEFTYKIESKQIFKIVNLKMLDL